MDGFDGSHFDHVFGNKATMYSADGSKVGSLDSRMNSFGGVDLLDNGKYSASTMSNHNGNGHSTFTDGMRVSSTFTDQAGDTQIHGSVGEQIGTIKDFINGDGKELYIGEKMVASAENDVSGNKKILLLEDPLSKAHEYALMELILSK